MKIFTKIFLYTLALLVMIALLANGLVYNLMPKVYINQKQQELKEQTDKFVEQLKTAKRDEIIALMAQYADTLQMNLIIKIGNNSYSMLTWNSGVITEINESDSIKTSAGNEEDISNNSDTIEIVTIADNNGVQIISDTASTSVTVSGTSSQNDGTFTGIVSSGEAGSKTIEVQRNFTIAGEEGTLTAALTLAPVDQAVQVIVSLLPISLFLCIIIAIIFSLLYARTITRPIKAISQETHSMIALERDAQCNVVTKDEIGTLATNVNNLYENLLGTIESLEIELKKVGAVERAKTNFLWAASHELKTPVTAVSVIMDNMILNIGKYKNHDEWLPKCKKLLDNLSDMLREILDASHLEDVTEASVTKSIESICAEIIEPYVTVARAKGFTLYIDWSASFPVTLPPKLLGKALSNIFSNAVQYTVPGGKLSVYCKGRSLVVENECTPIPEDHLSQLFDPFYRPDDSRNRATGGNGLGLYITDSVLHLLELNYSFEPMTSPEGMRFTINF